MLIVSLPVDQEASKVFAPFAGIHVGNEHILQTQVKAFVLRGVGQEEERPEAQRDEGTKDKEQDKFLRESQGSSVVREGRRPQVQRGQPPPGQRQQGGGGHPSDSDPNAGRSLTPRRGGRRHLSPPAERCRGPPRLGRLPARRGGRRRLHHPPRGRPLGGAR